MKSDTLIISSKGEGNRAKALSSQRKGSPTRSQGNGQYERSENLSRSLQLGGPCSPSAKRKKSVKHYNSLTTTTRPFWKCKPWFDYKAHLWPNLNTKKNTYDTTGGLCSAVGALIVYEYLQTQCQQNWPLPKTPGSNLWKILKLRKYPRAQTVGPCSKAVPVGK